MHKINRIGNARISQWDRANSTPAVAYTGSAISGTDMNHYQINATNFAEDGGSVDAAPTGTFTFSSATKMGFGIMADIDIPFGNTVAVEMWADAYFALSLGAFVFGYVGQVVRTGALPAAASITNVQDVCLFDIQQPLSPESVTGGARMISVQGNVNVRRNDALPFRIALGIGIANPGADVLTRAVRHISVGYRTLADQYAHSYYDPAR